MKLVGLIALVLAGAFGFELMTGGTGHAETAGVSEPAPDGAALFAVHCSSCHGTDGAGDVGPSLVGVGAASADFQLRSGRMPLSDVDAVPIRKPSPFDAKEIDALTAYIAALGDGPAIPVVDVGGANVAHGGDLYRSNCASCHGAAGRGGALSDGWNAPNLYAADPTEIVEAIRIGPGQMPVFDPGQLDAREVEDIAGYVNFLQTEPDPGGFGLGRLGPVPEGIVACLLGLGTIVLLTRLIERSRR